MFGLSPHSLHVIREIFSRCPDIENAVLFGSRAKGNYREGSDIDLALSGPPDLAKRLHQLQNDFEESDLPYRVDLIYLPNLKHPELREHIARVGKLIYSSVR